MNTQLNTTGAIRNPLIRFSILLCMFVAGIASFSPAHAEGMGHDVTRFDVAGVRLGMSYQQAKAAAAAYFGIGDTVIPYERCFGKSGSGDCLQIVNTALCQDCKNKDGTITVGIVGETMYPGALFFKGHGGEELMIGFANRDSREVKEGRVKADEVLLIKLDDPKPTSPELVNKYVQELKRKYGSPSVDGSITAQGMSMTNLQWCAKLDPPKRKDGRYKCTTKPGQSDMFFLSGSGVPASLTLRRKTGK